MADLAILHRERIIGEARLQIKEGRKQIFAPHIHFSNLSGSPTFAARRNDPDGVNDARDITKQSQKDVDPELHADTDLQKDAKRRENNGKNDPKNVHEKPRLKAVCVTEPTWSSRNGFKVSGFGSR